MKAPYAEAGGFEPPVRLNPYVSLANWWFQPLTQTSFRVPLSESSAKVRGFFQPAKQFPEKKSSSCYDSEGIADLRVVFSVSWGIVRFFFFPVAAALALVVLLLVAAAAFIVAAAIFRRGDEGECSGAFQSDNAEIGGQLALNGDVLVEIFGMVVKIEQAAQVPACRGQFDGQAAQFVVLVGIVGEQHVGIRLVIRDREDDVVHRGCCITYYVALDDHLAAVGCPLHRFCHGERVARVEGGRSAIAAARCVLRTIVGRAVGQFDFLAGKCQGYREERQQ